MVRRLLTIVGFFAGVLAPTAVLAQESSGAQPSVPVAKPAAPQPPVTAGEGGFVIQSENSDFHLRTGVLAHADARFGLGDDDEAVASR